MDKVQVISNNISYLISLEVSHNFFEQLNFLRGVLRFNLFTA